MEKCTFTDPRDGKTYRTVKIGEQVWMAENLAYAAEGSKCNNNKPSNCQKYGKLYDWNTAMKVSPPGWHLPNKEEWWTLVNFVGGEKIAGNKLKARSGFVAENDNGTDDYGFSALMGGDGHPDGSFRGVCVNADVSVEGGWWSSSEYDSEDCGYAYYMGIYRYEEHIYWNYNGKNYLYSVRCLQD